MRCAVLPANGRTLVVESLERTAPGPFDVVVEVGASGVCHSDLSVRDGLFAGLISSATVLGHEGAGKVLEVGPLVTKVSVGDRVVTSFRPACGSCRSCLRGRTHLCDAHGGLMKTVRGTRADGTPVVAVSGLGTFSDVMVCHEMSLVPVSTELPDEQLALLGCGLTTGVGAALFTADVEPGSTVAVIGCGGVGQAVVQGAVIAGAARIFAVDPVAAKREMALRLGATDAIDPRDHPPSEQLLGATSGLGVDYAFDVVGAPTVVESSYRMVGKGGMLILVGYGPLQSELRLPAFDLQGQEKTVKGCVAGSAQVRRDFQKFIDLIERGRLDTEALVSETIGLDQVNRAMDNMQAGDAIRSVITKF